MGWGTLKYLSRGLVLLALVSAPALINNKCFADPADVADVQCHASSDGDTVYHVSSSRVRGYGALCGTRLFVNYAHHARDGLDNKKGQAFRVSELDAFAHYYGKRLTEEGTCQAQIISDLTSPNFDQSTKKVLNQFNLDLKVAQEQASKRPEIDACERDPTSSPYCPYSEKIDFDQTVNFVQEYEACENALEKYGHDTDPNHHPNGGAELKKHSNLFYIDHMVRDSGSKEVIETRTIDGMDMCESALLAAANKFCAVKVSDQVSRVMSGLAAASTVNVLAVKNEQITNALKGECLHIADLTSKKVVDCAKAKQIEMAQKPIVENSAQADLSIDPDHAHAPALIDAKSKFENEILNWTPPETQAHVYNFPVVGLGNTVKKAQSGGLLSTLVPAAAVGLALMSNKNGSAPEAVTSSGISKISADPSATGASAALPNGLNQTAAAGNPNRPKGSDLSLVSKNPGSSNMGAGGSSYASTALSGKLADAVNEKLAASSLNAASLGGDSSKADPAKVASAADKTSLPNAAHLGANSVAYGEGGGGKKSMNLSSSSAQSSIEDMMKDLLGLGGSPEGADSGSGRRPASVGPGASRESKLSSNLQNQLGNTEQSLFERQQMQYAHQIEKGNLLLGLRSKLN